MQIFNALHGQVGLKKEGIIELMCEMDEVVLKLNEFQVSQLDSKVLVLFGIEAESNWKFSTPWNNVIYRVEESYTETIKYGLIVISIVPVLCFYPFLQKYFT